MLRIPGKGKDFPQSHVGAFQGLPSDPGTACRWSKRYQKVMSCVLVDVDLLEAGRAGTMQEVSVNQLALLVADNDSYVGITMYDYSL